MPKHHDDLDPDVERVVDELLSADKIIDRYRERCKALDIPAEFDPPGLMDRLMLVHTGLLAKHSGGGPGASSKEIFDRLGDLRNGLLQELKAYVENIVAGGVGYSTWTEDEERTIDASFAEAGLPALSTLLSMKPADVCKKLKECTAPPSQHVVIENKEKLHAEFQDVLFKKNVDERHAKRTLELLLTTQQGNDLLKLMVYDAVMIQRKQAAATKPIG